MSEDEPLLVFLVSPDPQTRAGLGSQMHNFGLSVAVVDDAGAVLDQVAERVPVAVVMELIDGAAAELAALTDLCAAGGESVPVFVVAGVDDFDLRLATSRAGAAGYFIRPVPVAQLVHYINTSLEVRTAAPVRVMLVDDQRSMAELFGAVLRHHGMEVLTLEDPRDVPQAIYEFTPDLLVTDIHMPHCSGWELARILRQKDSNAWLPIVFLTVEQATQENQVTGFHFGGDYFLHKGVPHDLFAATVRSRALQARRVRSQVTNDSMTGLLKHSVMLEILRHEAAGAKRDGRPLSLALVDLDNFKSVNDRYGHSVGDMVILAAAQALKTSLRGSDRVGRYGGEEFVVLLPDTDADNARIPIDRTREKFGAIVHDGPSGPFQVTFSAGIAQYRPGQDLAELLDAADDALYEAKEAGRDRVVLAS